MCGLWVWGRPLHASHSNLWSQHTNFEECWLVLEVPSAAGVKNFTYMVFLFPRAALTKGHKLGGPLNNRNVFSRSSGG